MKCRQVKALLPAFDDDELSATERNMIEQHLAACVDCTAALAATGLSVDNSLSLSMSLWTRILPKRPFQGSELWKSSATRQRRSR